MSTISGTSGNDSLEGTSLADKISGGSGDDMLSGEGGNDTLSGGSGEDSLYGGDGKDQLSGGSGEDSLYGGDGKDVLDGGSGSDYLSGGAGNDDIDGGSGNDTIDGGAGNDDIDGGSGSDTISGGDGRDEIEGGSGDDVVYGDAGNDILEGESGNDYLDGGDGNDKLYGGSGNDVLVGVDGADYLWGGSGGDTFVYLEASDSDLSNWDRIMDFQQGKDKIDLAALTHSTLAWGGQTALANGAWYQNSGSSTFVFADVDGDGAADLKIELKNTCGLELAIDDFVGVAEANSAPVAVDDVASAAEAGGAANAIPGLDPTGNVLANDTDADGGDTKTVTTTGTFVGSYGTLTLSADGSYSYAVDNTHPEVEALRNENDTLTDTFEYTMSDSAGATSTARLTFTISGANDAPVAVDDHADAVDNGSVGLPDATGNVLTSDTDADRGEILTVTGIRGDPSDHDGLGDMVTGKNGFGSILMQDDGSWSYYLTGSPAQGDIDEFEYTITDGHGGFSSAKLAIHFPEAGGTGVITSVSVTEDSVVADVVTGDSSSSEQQQSGADTSTPADGSGQPVSAADNVVTGVYPGDSLLIPEWALLANDQNAHGNPLFIESVGGAAGFDMVTLDSGLIEFMDADEFAASSFTYVANYGSSSGNPVMVSVSQDLDGSIDGTAGNDILVGARFESATFVGNGGDDILFGGHFSDTFDYNALSDRGTSGDVVSGFQKGMDKLDLHDLLATFNGYEAPNAFTGGFLQFTQSGSDTLVQVDGDGGADSFVTLLTLDGVSLNSSDTGDFIL